MSTLDLATPAQAQPRGRSLDIAAFVAGALAAALGIAIGELIGGLIAGAPSLVIAIGDLVIELQPPGAKDLFVTLFGEADKLVLNLMIVGAAILIAGGLGIAGRRRFAVPTVGFAVGHASAQMTWRGVLSRPAWRLLMYSTENPPARRAFAVVDGITGDVEEWFVEDNPEEWAA